MARSVSECRRLREIAGQAKLRAGKKISDLDKIRRAAKAEYEAAQERCREADAEYQAAIAERLALGSVIIPFAKRTA